MSLALLIGACASVPSSQQHGLPQAQGTAAAAEGAEAQQNWQQASAEWLALAGVRLDAEAQYYRSRALGALLNAEDAARARLVFDSLDQSLLAPVDVERTAVLQAELLLQEGRPGEALVALPLSLQIAGTGALQARFLEVRGMALAQQGALIPAIEDFTARSRLGAAGPDAQAWQFKLWPLLISADEETLRQGVRTAPSAEVSGWLRLALIGRQEWVQPGLFDSRLDGWQARNSLHAANASLLPALRSAHALRQAYPEKITVLLPLSGRFASVGVAIRDGMLAAWYRDGVAGQSTLQFLDTESLSISEWLAAQADAERLAVVGPLRKEKVDEFYALTADTNLLWLPLNQIEQSQEQQVQVVDQTLFPALALSPEQEAGLVADRMSKEGHRRALVIAAEGDWGQRVVAAFQQRFVESGGKVVGVERYQTGQSDYGDTIQRALLLDQSERRHAQLTRVLGRNIEFEARRRSDVDAVFAPGQPRSLRALRPQLKFYRASGLPVFATSHVWGGRENPAADLDLNGVRFPAMPWSLKPLERDERLKLDIAKAGGSEQRGRFYALGADAIRLLPILADQETGFPWVFPGGTGLLDAGKGGLLGRDLVWAYFRKGKPVLLPTAEAVPGA